MPEGATTLEQQELTAEQAFKTLQKGTAYEFHTNQSGFMGRGDETIYEVWWPRREVLSGYVDKC